MVQATVSTHRQKPRRHQTAIRDQAAVCSQTATALLPNLSLWGGFGESLRPRNLSVPRAGQAKRRARSPKRDALFAGSIRRGIETAANSSSATSNASAQFETGSARGQPRQAPRVRNPRSPARRPIQAYEVEPVPPVSQCGIKSQIETHSLCSLRCASVRHIARHAGPRLVQLLSMIGISTRIG